MNHIPALIKDLALILGAAGITTLLFKRLKQPVVLGYIIAGALVSPNFKFFPNIVDLEGIKIWADIGVIFLLFALGIEFSFKKLAKVGGSAAITGIVEISCMLLLGYLMGQALNWSSMDSLFLGGIIAISSTTIIFRAFDELNLKSKQFTKLVLGVLVIEDIVAILLMVLLSTLAVSREFEGTQMIFSILKLFFFLCLWFVLGIFLLPTFLKKAANWLTDETLLIVALALCLGMVLLADRVGFSAALGAFVMGSILAETTQAERIDHLISSVKNLFGAVFFVSVGMLIDPSILVQYGVPVLLLVCAVIFGKTIFVTIGALLSGKPLQKAVQAGTSMSQIGEFSFIIATLGVSLKVTSAYLYPIAVGVSVITTFTTPYMIKAAGPLYSFLEKTLPKKWINALNNYSSSSQTLEAENDWRKVMRFYMQIIIINTVVIVALILLFARAVHPFIMLHISNSLLAGVITVILGLIAMSPFIWALTLKKMTGNVYAALWLDSKYNHGPLLILEIIRSVLASLLIGFLLNQFFSASIAFGGTVIVMVAVLYIFRQRLQKFYQRIEDRFLHNLNEKELSEQKGVKQLSPWDMHISNYEINPLADFIGKTLESLAWREQYGINIAFIERGNDIIYAPGKTAQLFPYDKIGVIGTDQQLEALNAVLNTTHQKKQDTKDNIELQKIVIDAHTKLRGQSIRSSGIREKTNGLIVGIERNGERILNPASDLQFEWNDIVWIVGDVKKINMLYVH